MLTATWEVFGGTLLKFLATILSDQEYVFRVEILKL
jgi:hypothetical protein